MEFKEKIFIVMLRTLVFLYFILFSTSIFSKEIPIIVISAGKSPQSYSSVGSQVTVIDSEDIMIFANFAEYNSKKHSVIRTEI